ncbi:hypothetical protein SLEP1_g41607, partial [Rubroshorea leprosula]
GNLGSEKSSDVDNGSDDVSVIDWETSSDDSAWSLGSDKTDDEQVSIAELAQEVRKRRRNAIRSSRKKSKAAMHGTTRNEQEDDHVEEPVVTQEQPSVQQQATVQEATVTDAASIEETAREICSKGRKKKSVSQHKVRQGDGNRVRKGDPIDSTQRLPVSDHSGSFTDEEDRESDYANSDDPGAWKFHWNLDDEDDIFVQPDHVVSRNTYYREHRCFKSYDNELVTYTVVADLFKGRIYEAPFTKPAEIVKWCKTEIKVNITLDKAKKAKKHVMTQLEGSYVGKYKYLKSYAKILRDSHPENTAVVTTIETSSSDTITFHKMYVCLHSLKQGWKDGCRRFFGVDGCFLKGILESECLESWQRFFELLKTDLDHGNGAGITVMSDEHQAILSTVELILPKVEHRHCARHIYCNWAKLGHRGDEMKICFWNCAKVTFQDDFTDKLGARCKAIIAMNDDIRDQLMVRIADKRLFAKKWPEGDDIAPRIRKKLEELKAKSQGCSVQPNGVNEFEVNDSGDQHVVKFNDKTCTCRYWQLSGFPCPHALACIRYKRWRVEHYISDIYKKEKYLAAYAYPLQCIRKGTKAWKAVGEEELLPPPVKSMLRRPRRKRRRHKGEPQKIKKGKLRKLTGKGRKMTCKVCGNKGHNRRTCPYNNEEGRNESASARVKISGVNKRKKQEGEGASTSSSKKKKARVPIATGSFIGFGLFKL